MSCVTQQGISRYKMDTTWLILSLLLTVSSSSEGIENHQMTMHGSIKFLKNPPTTIPKQSCLIINFQDTSLQDAPAKEIAKKIVKQPELVLSDGKLPYNHTFKKPSSGQYSISATLNIGWCPKGGNEWLHNGDYLTTTEHPVNVKEGEDVYSTDIELEHYQTMELNVHNTRREEDPCFHAPCMNSICRSFTNGSFLCIKVAAEPCAIPMCTSIYEPICANNGKTYENACLMDADACEDGMKRDIYKVHDGECYAKRALLGGFLFGSCIVLLTIAGFFAVFFVWRRNRKHKIQDLAFGSVKKVTPLDM